MAVPTPRGLQTHSGVWDLTGLDSASGDPSDGATECEPDDATLCFDDQAGDRRFAVRLPQIFDRYIKTGKLELIFLDLPLESIHPLAFNAAEAAHCAGEQELFWEMHHELCANQRLLMPAKLVEYAQAVGVDLQDFSECLKSGRAPQGIRQDMRMAMRARISSTPAFLLGRRKPNDPDKVQVLETLRGARSIGDFEEAIERLLSESE